MVMPSRLAWRVFWKCGTPGEAHFLLVKKRKDANDYYHPLTSSRYSSNVISRMKYTSKEKG
jgi:hypothetical protein